jgi:hypothetical protein
MKALPLCLLLGACGLTLTACNIVGPAFYLVHGPEKIKRLYALDPKRPTVIFVDDRLNRIPRRASRVSMGEQAEHALMTMRHPVDMISSQSALQAAGADRGGKPVPITDVGAAVNAEVVIYAMVDEFALSRDGQTFSPGATMRVKVIEVATGKRLWPEERAGHPVVVRLSPKQGTQPDSTAARFAAEDELARQCGQELAWLFYDHEAPTGLKGVE